MTPIDAIGGYFGLEVGPRKKSPIHVDQGQKFDTIRSALLALLEHLVPRGTTKKLWFPAFICPSVYQVTNHLGSRIELCHYNLSSDLTPRNLTPQHDDLVYHYSVFGMTPPNGRPGLIVDNAHAFFAAPRPDQHTLYSARKFVGLADGAILSSPVMLDPLTPRKLDASASFLLLRADQGAEAGFEAFRHWEAEIFAGEPRGMSQLTRTLLQTTDFEYIRTRRRQNFNILQDALGGSNKLGPQAALSISDDRFVPFSYPYLIDGGAERRSELASRRIYTPTLWNELITQSVLNEFERYLARDCLHLPVDQRYGPEEIRQIIEAVA